MPPLDALLAEIRACRICQNSLPHGIRPVVQAHPDARILIAGQAPGRKVHATGIPFNDPSGDRLRDWLGIDRNTFYNPARIALVPMGFCYPGTGPSGDLPPRPECAEAWRKPLLDRLPDIRLTIPVGRYAIDWHMAAPGRTLAETVKGWQDHLPEMLPLPHPSPRNNRWLRNNPWFEAEVLPELKRRVAALLGE